MHIGQKVYTVRSTGWDLAYSVGTVVKVTPSGMVDISHGSDTYTTRFGTDGREVGKNKYRASSIDGTPFAEREEMLAEEKRAQQAANFIGSIQVKDGINKRWGIDGFNTELDRLQALITEARGKVNGIKSAPVSQAIDGLVDVIVDDAYVTQLS